MEMARLQSLSELLDDLVGQLPSVRPELSTKMVELTFDGRSGELYRAGIEKHVGVRTAKVEDKRRDTDNNKDAAIMEQRLFEDDVLLSVAVFSPIHFRRLPKPGDTQAEKIRSRRQVVTQKWQVLGKSRLTALRDKIECVEDYSGNGPNRPSGYFLIEKIFYSDMRFISSIDYSKNLLEWLSSTGLYTDPQFDVFKSCRMEDATFNDLKISIGTPYRYVHQGDCEHVIVFTRMVSTSAESRKLIVSDFPRQEFMRQIFPKPCEICHSHASQFVVYYDKLAPKTPCHFCKTCFSDLHYDERDGTLLYDDFFAYEHQPD
eukprot:CAMPEP_0119135250 /NCGR_PEP_ID=MMETSP1310-20130426/18922_1 /TAXON_ID=464262 /ORGANISM="Genus nov. species nov., Strain RCC2339" /LENGTH=316 /DNA_ID=CAMNT_0007126117 /DNA_START=25 /DNA_END=972 /DNA_ORIENTATION=-